MGYWLGVILLIAGGEGEPPAGTRAVAAEGREINGRRGGQALGIPQQAAC